MKCLSLLILFFYIHSSSRFDAGGMNESILRIGNNASEVTNTSYYRDFPLVGYDFHHFDEEETETLQAD